MSLAIFTSDDSWEIAMPRRALLLAASALRQNRPLKAARKVLRHLLAPAVLAALLFYPALANNFDGGLDALHKGYFKEAAGDFSVAVKEGHSSASIFLGLMAWHGVGIAQDANQAVRYFSYAADRGDPVAQYYLGMLYKDDFGLRNLERAAQAGYAPAQVDLGQRHHTGFGVEQDFEKAALWYEKAAKAGEPRAYDRLSVMHYYGQWYPQNVKIAAYNAIIAMRLYRSKKFQEVQVKNLRTFAKSLTASDLALIEYSGAETANDVLRNNRSSIEEMIMTRAYLGSDFEYLVTKQPSLVGEMDATDLFNFLERGMAYFITGRCAEAREAFEKADERGEGQGRARVYLNKMQECEEPRVPQGA
jgi:TPR repeat protein